HWSVAIPFAFLSLCSIEEMLCFYKPDLSLKFVNNLPEHTVCLSSNQGHLRNNGFVQITLLETTLG
ncbi:hypothetical protein AVEN_123481-2-1, partial [Araneus ventricosus]